MQAARSGWSRTHVPRLSRLGRLAERAHSEARPPAALHADAVFKRFGDREVLRAVSLSLPVGSVGWLNGPNGCGKTTLLRIVVGIVAADAGNVRLFGVTTSDGRRAYHRRLGWLPAGDRTLHARLTAEQNVDLAAAMALIPRAVREALCAAALERFGARDLADRRVDRLSLGQRQRVRLACATVHDPDVLLLDEPYTSLDEGGLELLAAALAELTARGGAALWASPSLEGGKLPADQAFTLSDGRVSSQ